MRRLFWKAAQGINRLREALLRLQSKLERLSRLRPTGSMYYLPWTEVDELTRKYWLSDDIVNDYFKRSCLVHEAMTKSEG